MRFVVVPNDGSVPGNGTNVSYLWTDNWNDWWEFQTLYVLTVFDAFGEKHELGGIKIGQFGMAEKQSRPALPAVFDQRDERFFSLGQDVSYYIAMMELDPQLSQVILDVLGDLAADDDLYQRALEERVTGVSLLRDVASATLETQFRRVLAGGAPLTDFSFSYETPVSEPTGVAVSVAFEVTPNVLPPTNVHVLIGRNGAGKSHMLNGMARAIVFGSESPERDGRFWQQTPFGPLIAAAPFAGVVSVTFSAFDDFELLRPPRDTTKAPRYRNIGLRREIKDRLGNTATVTREPIDLLSEFSASAKVCSRGAKRNRWLAALKTLETDSIFAEIAVADLLEVEEGAFVRQANELFRKLSSGHKIVLLTITQLVESVEERTLVLMDEPEAHLHPPLLSAFVRALSDLLTDRNGVAIIATHSPVVLQEVPKKCVWKIIRHGHSTRVDRPDIETFAENVGVLTSEVFGLEVTRSGYHRMLEEGFAASGDSIAVLNSFGDEVGAEGRAILSALRASQRRVAER